VKKSVFTETEQKAIEEKVEQLKRIKAGTLSVQELVSLIVQRRLNWLKENLKRLLKKYAYLDDLEKAHMIIGFENMKIDQTKQKITRISRTKIRIDSYNFCPYLEACKILGLDTRFVCKEIMEKSTQIVLEAINPRIGFSRNYQNIRPYNPDYCEEYLELVED